MATLKGELDNLNHFVIKEYITMTNTIKKIISVIITVAICVSTLTTRQHVIVDVAGGIALAEFSYLIVDKIGFTRIYQRSMKYIEQRISR